MEGNTSPVLLLERPELRAPYVVAAFAGWPDAGEVATGTLRYLMAKLGARRLGQIEMDAFVAFTNTRPATIIEQGAIQILRYPAGDLFYWRNPGAERDVIFLMSDEPQLRWRQYIRIVLGLSRDFEVSMLVSLGGLFDAVPHTAPTRVSGVATSRELRDRLRSLDVALTDYHGPSSIHSALATACKEYGVDGASLWGHAPLYVRSTANPKVCHALLTRLCHLLSVALNLDDLKAAGEYLDTQLNRLLDQNEGLRQYVGRLQEQYEGTPEGTSGGGEEDTERIIRDVEEFLRREHGRGEPPEG